MISRALLEVVVAAELSKDPILCQEIRDAVDLHDRNRTTLGLPSRLIAKIFVFRLIYGGTAYAYSVDPDFAGVGKSQLDWQRVIDAFYAKYKGLKEWHDSLVRTVKETGILEIPSGRFYQYTPKRNYRGELQWPRTTILNYPVQCFGADLVMLARIEFFSRFQSSGLEGTFIQTIHDSLVVDIPQELCYTIGTMLKESVEAVPDLCRKYFDYDFSLPLTCELQVGPNKKDLVDYKL